MTPFRYLVILNLLLVFSCTSTKTVPQIIETKVLPEDLTIVQDLDFFELDKFEQLYLVKEDKVVLLDNEYKLKYSYENDRYGDITSLDVSNPQKVLIFYKDFDTVVTLDNTLSETGIIDLKKFEYIDIPQASLSNDNYIWLYDPIQFVLRKIDNRGTVLSESLPLSNLGILPQEITRLRENNNKVFLVDRELGILVFDNFGQYIKSLPLTGLSDFQRIGNNIIYLDGGGFFSYGIDNFGKMQLEAMDERDRDQIKQIRISGAKSYVGFTQGIRISNR